jgi:hypothetical protein
LNLLVIIILLITVIYLFIFKVVIFVNVKKVDFATSMMLFIFFKQCQQVYCTHTLFFRKDHNIID